MTRIRRLYDHEDQEVIIYDAIIEPSRFFIINGLTLVKSGVRQFTNFMALLLKGPLNTPTPNKRWIFPK